MFDRSILKSNAKNVLSQNYWNMFLAGFIVYIVSAFIELMGSGDKISEILSAMILGSEDDSIILLFLSIIAVLSTIGAIIYIVGSLFVITPLSVGWNKYHLECRKGYYKLSSLFSAFTNGNFFNIVKNIFVTNLIIFLWSLLIFPGIYFSYAYYLVPYICAENPGISASEARRISKLMTDGYKFDIWILELSFIGWELLAAITLVGGFFLIPYKQATYAELYIKLRDEAIAKGKISPEEVGVEVVILDSEESVF